MAEEAWIPDRTPTGHRRATLVERHDDGWRLPSHPTEPGRRPGPLVDAADVRETEAEALAEALARWGRGGRPPEVAPAGEERHDLTVVLGASHLAALDAYAERHQLRGRGAAVRRLIEEGAEGRDECPGCSHPPHLHGTGDGRWGSGRCIVSGCSCGAPTRGAARG